MGLTGARIFLDSCITIYLIEEHEAYAAKIEALIASSLDADFAISDLTVMECLVGPLRSGHRTLEDKYNRWFQDVKVFSVTRGIFTDAAKIRAEFPSLKTPDAIHLATALHYNCDEFWTNDERLSKVAPNIVRNIIRL